MNYLSGPSLTILSYDLNQAKIDELIPYPAVLGSYISPADAAARYTNLQDWYALHGHFWVGSGPYYLDSANFSGKTLTLKANTYYVDLADKWIDYIEPKVGDVAVSGPAHVDAGTSATFNVDVNYQGSPYPSAEIEKVTYVLTSYLTVW
jgi:peptide/nickel transport system substrate-binding protein